MIVRDTRERKTTEVFASEIECDRCGEVATKAMFEINSDYPFEGVYIRGRLIPASGNAADFDRIEVELCGPCSAELVHWVNEGEGPGAFVGKIGRDLDRKTAVAT